MKNLYSVQLVNVDNCIFDNGEFTSLKQARSWASGRGETLKFDEWHKYTVLISKNKEKFMEYKTK